MNPIAVMTKRRCLLPLLLPLLLALACRSPLTSLRKEPFLAVEVVGPPAAEAKELAERLGRKLGVPAYDPALGSLRTLRLTLGESDPSSWADSLVKTTLISTAGGGLTGLILQGTSGAGALATARTWERVVGAGLVVGAGMGVYEYYRNQERIRALGYYPWAVVVFTAELVIRGDTGGYAPLVDYRTPRLDPRPYQQPLPPGGRTREAIRRQSGLAYADALGEYLVREGIPSRTP